MLTQLGLNHSGSKSMHAYREARVLTTPQLLLPAKQYCGNVLLQIQHQELLDWVKGASNEHHRDVVCRQALAIYICLHQLNPKKKMKQQEKKPAQTQPGALILQPEAITTRAIDLAFQLSGETVASTSHVIEHLKYFNALSPAAAAAIFHHISRITADEVLLDAYRLGLRQVDWDIKRRVAKVKLRCAKSDKTTRPETLQTLHEQAAVPEAKLQPGVTKIFNQLLFPKAKHYVGQLLAAMQPQMKSLTLKQRCDTLWVLALAANGSAVPQELWPPASQVCDAQHVYAQTRPTGLPGLVQERL